jgi:hypothetical protein
MERGDKVLRTALVIERQRNRFIFVGVLSLKAFETVPSRRAGESNHRRAQSEPQYHKEFQQRSQRLRRFDIALRVACVFEEFRMRIFGRVPSITERLG